MDVISKLLCPEEHFRQFLCNGVRVDGRRFDEFRPTVIQANVVSTADGSAMVRHGGALIIASVRAELGRPRPHSCDKGVFELRVQSCVKSESSGIVLCAKDTLQSLLDNGSIIQFTDLCIEKGKLCWVLICDVVVLDGPTSLDSCLVALSAALHCTSLPTVTYKSSSNIDDSGAGNEASMEDADDADENLFTPARIQVDRTKRTGLKINQTKPVASTFMILRLRSEEERVNNEDAVSGCIVVVDPSSEEIDALNSDGDKKTISIIIGESKSICNLNLATVGQNLDNAVFQRCITLADGRRNLINRLITEACVK